MKSVFVRTLTELAAQHSEIMFLTGDHGFGIVEQFKEKCPHQFVNMGAAEQNMIGVATGLASRGFVPFSYSMVNASVLRPLEFIRNGPVAHQVPVRIVGVGLGFEYGSHGPTHFGVEDIACLRSFGGIDIVIPADTRRAKAILERMWNAPRPLYFRIGSDDRLVIPELDEATNHNGFSILKRESKEGPVAAVVCLGSAIEDGLRARRLLSRSKTAVELFCVEVINDDVMRRLALALASFRAVVTVEAHSVRGGMGSAIAESLGELGGDRQVHRLGIHRIPDFIGAQKTLENACGFDAIGIVNAVEISVASAAAAPASDVGTPAA
jgi:transketolase